MPTHYIAVFDYQPDADDPESTALKVGDKLICTEEEEDGWITVENLTTKRSGYVPATFIEVDKSAPPSPVIEVAPGPVTTDFNSNRQSTPSVGDALKKIRVKNLATGQPARIPENCLKIESELKGKYVLYSVIQRYDPGSDANSVFEVGQKAVAIIAPPKPEKSDEERRPYIDDKTSGIDGHLGYLGTLLSKGPLFTHGGEAFINNVANDVQNRHRYYKFLNDIEIQVEGGHWKVIHSNNANYEAKAYLDEPFTLLVRKTENKDHQGNSLFNIALETTAKKSSFPPYVTRSIVDFIWLDKKLREKFPFCTIPEFDQRSEDKRFHKRIQAWCNYICNHSVLRTSYYLYIFLLKGGEVNLFRNMCHQKDQWKDKILTKEMFHQIQVTMNSKSSKDMQEQIHDLYELTCIAQEQFDRSLTAITLNIKEGMMKEFDRLETVRKLGDGLDAYSRSLNKVDTPQAEELSKNLKSCGVQMKAIKGLHQSKRYATDEYMDIVEIQHKAVKQWYYNIKPIGDLKEKYTKLKDLYTSRIISEKSYNLAKARVQNVYAIYKAENNQVISEFNRNFKNAITTYLTLEISEKKKDVAALEVSLNSLGGPPASLKMTPLTSQATSTKEELPSTSARSDQNPVNT